MGIEQHIAAIEKWDWENKDIAFYASLGRHTAYHERYLLLSSHIIRRLISEDDLLFEILNKKKKCCVRVLDAM